MISRLVPPVPRRKARLPYSLQTTTSVIAAPATYPIARPNVAPVTPAPASTSPAAAVVSTRLSRKNTRRFIAIRPRPMNALTYSIITPWPSPAIATARSGHRSAGFS